MRSSIAIMTCGIVISSQRGLEEAAVISREARDQGRKRQMSPTEKALPGGSGAAKGTVKDEVHFVDS